MSALYELVANQQWQMAITHIQSLADGDAADQVLYQHDASPPAAGGRPFIGLFTTTATPPFSSS